MNRRLLTSLLKQSWRSSSTSSGLRGKQQPTQAITHQYPKVDPIALVSSELNAMVGDIHKELDDELKNDSELGAMSK